MKKATKILLAYYSPFFVVLAYLSLASPTETNRILRGVRGEVLGAYGVAGLLMVPLLAFGRPSATMIKHEVWSHQVQVVLKRKLLTIVVSLVVAVVVVLTFRLIPQHDVLSLALDIAVFLIALCVLIWMRFKKRAG